MFNVAHLNLVLEDAGVIPLPPRVDVHGDDCLLILLLVAALVLVEVLEFGLVLDQVLVGFWKQLLEQLDLVLALLELGLLLPDRFHDLVRLLEQQEEWNLELLQRQLVFHIEALQRTVSAKRVVVGSAFMRHFILFERAG